MLFGQILSWYSLPCRWTNRVSAAHSRICKRQIKAVYFHDLFRTTSYRYTRCLSGDLYAMSQCFTVKSGMAIGPDATLTTTTKNAADLYFVRLFSLLAWQTLQIYYITIGKSHKGDISLFCIAASSFYRPPFAHKKNIVRHQSLCDRSNATRSVSLTAQYLALPQKCQGSMLKCKDGSCITHESLCLWRDNCSPTHCSCHTGGRDIHDVHYCLNICAPSDCICPHHHFQCTSGGCIKMTQACDGEINCKDASDEFCGLQNIRRKNNKLDTELHTLISKQYFCLAFLCFSGECLSMQYVNDLLADCSSGQGEDEPLFTQLREGNAFMECNEPNTFPCVPGLPNCFPLDKLCYYDFDVDGNTL